jgi:lauroyl/myristoyl acyltransferase
VSGPARVIAAGYFGLAGRTRSVSMQMYRLLLPERPPWWHLWLAWRQFQSFTSLFVDRLRLLQGRDLAVRVEGREHLEELQAQGRGAVLLMSHVGNWEVAAYLLADLEPSLMLLMGQRRGQEVEARQKEELRRARVRLVQVAEGGGSPFDGLEALQWLRCGGLVSLAGDVIWARERTVAACLAGGEVRLPAAPHNLALASGAPVVVFFALRRPDGGYTVRIHPPHWVQADQRNQRQQAVAESVQRYAELLEQTVREAPEQWYWFEPRFTVEGHSNK